LALVERWSVRADANENRLIVVSTEVEFGYAGATNGNHRQAQSGEEWSENAAYGIGLKIEEDLSITNPPAGRRFRRITGGNAADALAILSKREGSRPTISPSPSPSADESPLFSRQPIWPADDRADGDRQQQYGQCESAAGHAVDPTAPAGQRKRNWPGGNGWPWL
jgi:hypothetical protein